MKTIPTLNSTDWLAQQTVARTGLSNTLYAMYSSVTGGITTDPALMNVPLDDHLVHRGDGVFESLRCAQGHLYNAEPHLNRLEKSCAGIGMSLHLTHSELMNIIGATIRAGGNPNCLVRLIVSRGTGTMGIDPALCNGPQLYVLIYRLTARGERGFPAPVKAGISRVPIKAPQFAIIKTCNYLPNVMMKLEAAERGIDFTISIDANGFLGEGATENFAIVTAQNELLMPRTDHVLAGTTARRALELGHHLVQKGILTCAETRDIRPKDAQAASEMFLLGTTADCTPITEFEGTVIGDGSPGPIAKTLYEQLSVDMTPTSEKLTNVFEPHPTEGIQ